MKQIGIVNKFDSNLTIENVTVQDGGLYVCKTFNVTKLEANVTVTVYGKFCSWSFVTPESTLWSLEDHETVSTLLIRSWH